MNTTFYSSSFECRCADCEEAGVECPQGYGVYLMMCAVCGHRVALVRPECAEWPVESSACPECSLHELEIVEHGDGRGDGRGDEQEQG